MQADNYNYEPDDQFTDKAWLEMRELLDQEMPVEKKKRRGFFWLFMLIGIGVAGAIWAFLPKNATAPIANQEQGIISINKSGALKNKNENIVLFENSKPKVNDEITTITNSKKTNTINNNSDIISKNLQEANDSKGKQYIYKNDKRIDFAPNPVNDFLKTIPVDDSELNSNPIENSKKTESKKPLIASKIDFTSIHSLQSLLDLNPTEALLLEEKMKEFTFESVVEELAPPKREKEFGVFVGTLLDFSNTSTLGIFGGAYIHFPLGKKLGIRTGLGYSFLPKSDEYNFQGTQSANVIDELTNNSSAAATLEVQSSTIFELQRMEYLDLPILLTYQPNRKLQFQLGANGSYLINDGVDAISNGLDLISDPGQVVSGSSNYGFSSVDLSSVSLRQYAEEEIWKRYDVSSVIGVAFQPTQKWNIELQYHRGWIGFLKDSQNELQDSNRSGVYNVSNDGSLLESADNNTFFKKKNINQSLRLSIGYRF